MLVAAVVGAAALVCACAGPPRSGGRRVYAQHRNSIEAHCPHNPALCATTAKGVTDGIPPLVTAGASLAITAIGRTVTPAGELDAAMQPKVDAALKECADMARSAMLIKHFPRGGPTPEDCDEMVPDSRGELKPRAMVLGEEMHRTAFICVAEKLGDLLPGQFSIEQRYRYDPQTRTTTVVTSEEAKYLLRQGGAELRGTLVPDVVIHMGDPRLPRAVYDFKFPCANTDKWPNWSDYPSGHPFSHLNQGKLYFEALGRQPARIVPRLGVLR
jgi:hypothetical protein